MSCGSRRLSACSSGSPGRNGRRPDLAAAAAARLIDQTQATTHELMERLVDAQLLEAARPGRYRFHDLVRLYAREHAARQHSEPARLTALVRMIGFYTATAWRT